jgi:FkbH-like protein
MILRLSQFVHMAPVGEGRILLIHAASQLRLVIDQALANQIALFRTPQDLDEETYGPNPFAPLRERGVLTELTPEAELAALSETLGATHGRDPAAALDQYRRQTREGGESYWAVERAMGLDDMGFQQGKPALSRLDVILFGDCDIQMEADFLRQAATDWDLDLRVAAVFPDDLSFAAEHRHDLIIIGALRARHLIVDPKARTADAPAFTPFANQARAMIEGLRARTSAPILIDNLPEPTVQPLGLAERGLEGHRTRFRLANVALAELAEAYPDVHVVDVAASLASAGSARLLDDAQVSFTHFGSPGWMLQRPQTEKAAVHHLFPDPAPLIADIGADPYARERLMARTHVETIVAVVGHQRKKCIILDLDGTLWPGVLAETGAPFAWSPEISGPFSYIGLYFGLHEALLCLKRRGIVLACVSKNDEALVRDLWRYPDHYPKERLLTPDDFVTWRVNWDDKATNIRSIAEELGFALDTFVFIDDHPVERARIQAQAPEVEVWGDDPFSLRRRLLADPRLQPPRITADSAARTDLTKAQLGRQAVRKASVDEAAFLESLQVETKVARLALGDDIDRVRELFERTTQFNTTGIKPSCAELAALLNRPDGAIFTARVRDRFGDQGLVGAALIQAGEIIGLALSCRVLGLRVEQSFLAALLADLGSSGAEITAKIVPTARNTPVRNVYRDTGFTLDADGVWRWSQPPSR